MVRVLGAAFAWALVLSGCGTASFATAVAVIVETPQQVSVFDSQMGDSSDWAGQWLGPAAPGAPYTREVPTLATKFVGDSSLPSAVRFAIYLPDRTDTGYYAVSMDPVTAGSRTMELPFVAWYSPGPVAAQSPLPVALETVEGSNGWLVNVTVEEAG